MRDDSHSPASLQDLHLLYAACRICDAVPPRTEVLFDSINQLLKSIIRIEEYCLMLEKLQTGRFEVWSGNDRILAAIGDCTFQVGDGVAEPVVHGRQALLVDGTSRNRSFLDYGGMLPGAGALLSLPLLAGDGRVFGILNLHHRQPGSFGDQDKIFFQEMADILANAIQRTLLYEKACREAVRDELTGIYNRRYFQEHIRRELFRVQRCRSPLVLALLDLDHFKAVNDTYGHQTGDRVLIKLAELLRRSLRCSDLIARYGGEEFVIMLSDTTMADARMLLTKLHERTARELVPTNGSRSGAAVTFTAGLSSFPEDGETCDKLLAVADRRLYLGKSNGRNQLVWSSPPE